MPLMYNNDDEHDEKAARALKRQMDLALRFDNNDHDFGDQRDHVDRQKQAKRLKKMQRRQRKAS